MIILIEGPDKAGKTTLVNMLSERLNMPVYKESYTPLDGKHVADSQNEDSAIMNMLISLDSPDLIMDRFYPSEYAYGVGLDRTFDVRSVFELDNSFSKLDHLCVYLHISENVYEEREGDELTLDEFYDISNAYDGFIGRSKCRFLILDGALPTQHHVEMVMQEIIEVRPSKDTVYMRLAKEVARRSTCLSRRTGAVLLSENDHVIATGYNGAPAGMPHQTECQRLRIDAKSGAALDTCNDVHAEENAIIQAALNGSSTKNGTLYTVKSPCHRCARMIINAEISAVVYSSEYGDTRAFELFETAGVEVRSANVR